MTLAPPRAMLRITQVDTGAESHFLIEGRVTHDNFAEITRLTGGSSARVALDLSGVTFVDQRSVPLLRELRVNGVVLAGCSGFLRELLGPDTTERAAADPLLEDVRRGDERGFATLVRREGGRMLATARRLLGNEEDARDAVQDAFLQAHRAIDRFEGGSRISTWLHRIVVNAALMKLRSRRRKPEQSLDELLPEFDESGAWLRPVRGWDRSCEELLESAEVRTAVRAAIDRLPAPYREVLVLRDIEEFDTAETARMLEASETAIKVRLHRARQALRSLLESQFAQ